MVCCLNSGCYNPQCADDVRFCSNCGTPLLALRNRYLPIKPLGGGGFGKTYLALDIDKLNEKCVIKQFAPHVQGSAAQKKATELFEQEARQLQQLGGHPQIPTLLAYFEEDRRLYLVQEFIDGQNLLQELEQLGPLNEQKIRELLVDLLNILKTVHQHNVIHRDIKLENIIRRRSDDKLVLIDFGASKQLSATVMTRQGTAIGSFGYVPIEQMQEGWAYRASDLYSVGATCFHLLSGISPRELHKKQGYGWVNNWQQHLKQGVSQQLKQILDKLLQQDYHQRYQSAEEVLQDLSPTKPSISSISSAKANVKVKKLLFIGSALVFLGLGGYAVWQTTTTPLLVRTVPFENLELAHTLEDRNPVSAIAISPDEQILVSGSASTTGAIEIWDLRTRKRLHTINGHQDRVDTLAITPDGQTLVSGSADKTIKIWDLKTRELLHTLDGQNGHQNFINTITISPSGQIIVSGSKDKTIKIWNLKTGELQKTLTEHSNSVISLAFSSDGNTLASGDRDGTINLWDINTGTLKNSLPNSQEPNQEKQVWAVIISPDSKTLISGHQDKTIKIWDLQTAKLKTTLTEHTGFVGSLAISSDGKTLVSGSNDKTIKIWDLSNGNLKRSIDSIHEGWVNSIVISPDESFLVSSGGGSIKIWNIL